MRNIYFLVNSIEKFSHDCLYSHGKYDAETKETYSSFMRELRKENPELINKFQTTFKKYFDKAFLDGQEELGEYAMKKTMEEFGDL